MFLFIYLVSTTELYQLLKAPLLVEHFIEHREANKDLTLWKFLYIHYAMGDVKDADYESDMKLPFKTHGNITMAVSNVFLPSLKVIIEKPVQFLQNKSFVNKDLFLQSSFLSNIWQPPRSC